MFLYPLYRKIKAAGVMNLTHNCWYEVNMNWNRDLSLSANLKFPLPV